MYLEFCLQKSVIRMAEEEPEVKDVHGLVVSTLVAIALQTARVFLKVETKYFTNCRFTSELMKTEEFTC